MRHRKGLHYTQLKKQWDPTKLAFETTDSLQPLKGIIGQERAVKAMDFGSRIHIKGYNIYVAGISGTGKTSYAKDFFTEIARSQTAPDDWCYVFNFENPANPVAVKLPSGKGRAFYQDMEELMQDLRIEIPKAFRGEEYENEKALILKELQEKRAALFNDFNRSAEEQGFQVNTTNSGIYFTPIIDGEPQEDEAYNQLDEETKKSIGEKMTKIQLQAVDLMRRIKELEKEAKKQARALDGRIGGFILDQSLQDLQQKYGHYPKVEKYLTDLKKDILEGIDQFKDTEEEEEPNPVVTLFRREQGGNHHRYRVNLLVDHSETSGAPVVIEYIPTYHNLFGSLEFENKLGNLITDFTMIRPGSFHMANGGYLILQAKDVLTTPFMWEGLKKVLKTRTICIENLRDQLGLTAITAIKPEPIPVDIKVILVGSDHLYRLLYEMDEDFAKLFKVKVDFDEEMPATYENLLSLASFIKGYCDRENSRPFHKEAVLRMAEYSARTVEHQEKLSTRFNDVVEILAEANTWAGMAGRNLVTAEDVDKAIDEKVYRSGKINEKMLEWLKDGTLMIDTQGEVAGQINGLSIMRVGDLVVGKPSRITAAAFIGRSGIINIEREVDMSGTSHSKGVMILSSYIGEKYAQEMPLTLSASITFEQLYSGVDGDSASSAELYAILSSLAKIPIKQGIAVTGSVNQKGEIQPVGGVSQKIEGFFQLCKVRGLTGDQGVMIPAQNIFNLSLKQEVIDAVRDGLFHIYPVKTVDEGMEVLTGMTAGVQLEDGYFEKDTIHEKVYNRLRQYALSMIQFGKDSQ